MDRLTLIAQGQSPVYRYTINQRYYALKVRLREQGETVEDLILGRLDHPGVVHCYGKFEVPKFLRKLVPGASQVLILDYIPGYPLRYLEFHPVFSVAMADQIITNLIDILVYLQSQHVVHRDIHPNNILYTHDRRIVLIDFEYATIGTAKPNPDIRSIFSIGDTLIKWIKIGDSNILQRRLDEIREIKSLDKIRKLWLQSAPKLQASL